MLCNLFEYYPWYCWLADQMNFLLNLVFDRTIIVLFSTVIAGFISITIPLALGIVSKHTEEYKDREISESFLKEWTYKYQVYVVLPIIFLSIFILACKIESGFLILSMIVLDFFTIIVFILFIRVVQQYATNFDDYYSNRLKKEADAIVNR
jgi:uncharacterized Tic20 family protein